MERTRITFLIVVAALAIPAVAWMRHAAATPVDSSPKASEEVAQVRTELADLREHVEQSRRLAVSAAQGTAAARLEPAAAPTQQAAQAPTELLPPKSAPSDEEVRARLTSHFTSESTDPAWSKPALSLISGHIQAGLPAGSQITSIECHRTMCRVESKHSSLEVYDHFLNDALLFPGGGWAGPIMVQVANPAAGAKDVTSVAFLLREGVDPALYAE